MKSGFCTLVDWLLIFAPRSYVWSADCCFLPKIGDIIHLKRNLHFLQRLCFSLFPMYCDCYRILKMALRFSFTAVKGVFSSGVWIFLCNSFSDLIYFVQFQGLADLVFKTSLLSENRIQSIDWIIAYFILKSIIFVCSSSGTFRNLWTDCWAPSQ